MNALYRALWIAGLAMLVGIPSLRADGDDLKKETRPVIDETQVYFGRAKGCKAPGVVDAAKVYRTIPEYKKIVDQKLTEKDVEYSLLLVKATKKFRAAVEGAASAGSCDLVANLGAVTWDGHAVPDLTDATLKKVEEQAKNLP